MPSLAPPRHAASLRERALTGAQIGAATGLLVASVDLSNALLGGYAGSKLGLALYALSLTVAMTAALGALLALFWTLSERLAARWPKRAVRWVAAVIDALPLAAFALYPPLAWLAEHYRELDERGQRLSGAALLALVVAALVAATLGRWSIARLSRVTRGYDLLCIGLSALAVLAGAACYLADARLYPDDYAEFHDGLAGCFVAALAIAAALLRSVLRRRAPKAALRAGQGLLVAAGAACVALGVLEQLHLDAFRDSRALVFGKLVVQARRLSDVDGDGYASVLGGGDCGPFDARRSPGAMEVPDNAVDEDCSGAAERWPLAPPAPVPRGKPGVKPNVLFITVDTLRADHLGTYGYQRPTSPNIDDFAKESVVFLRAFSQASKTWDSVPSFLTGMYPSNLPRNYKHESMRRRPATNYYLEESVGLLAEAFSAAGYTTNAVVTSAMLGALGLRRGFDGFRTAGDPTHQARKLIAGAREPFFIWLHYAGPHAPYKRHGAFDFGDEPIDRYDSEIAREDAQIASVLARLRRKKLADSTIVILNADHGEEFGEHGGQFHTRKQYRELLHVPLIMRVPGLAPARVDDVVELVDIVPTLHELCNLPPPRTRLDGQSLLAVLEAPRPAELGGAYAEDFHQDSGVRKRAIFDGRYRLIDDRGQDRQELYDVKHDPLEQRDIASARPELVSALRQRLAVRTLRNRSPRRTDPRPGTITTSAD